MQLRNGCPPVNGRHHLLVTLLVAGTMLAAVFMACGQAAEPVESTPGWTPTQEVESPQTPMAQPTEQVSPSPTLTPTAAATSAPIVPTPTPLRAASNTATPPALTRPTEATPDTEVRSESDARFVQVSAGSVHTCGLREDGTIICWGAGDEYEGRTGATGLLDSPPGGFTHIDAGYYHSCAVGMDGIVECWGGLYSDDASLTPEENAMRRALLGPPEGRFTSVSVGLWLDCGVKLDNSAECWGAGPASASASELNPPEGKYTSVSVGDFHACGIRVDQTVVCWGGNEGFNGEFLGQATPLEGPFEVINAGPWHTCGFRPEGEIRCWGSIVGGGEIRTCEQQPDGTDKCWVDEEVNAAHRAWGGWPDDAPDGDLKAMDSDQNFSCALWDSGHIGCWGSGGINEPPPPGIFKAVTVGNEHGCGLRPDGRVECWGEDEFGESSPP